MMMLSSILTAIAMQAAVAPPPPDTDQPDPARTVRVSLAPDGKSCRVMWRGADVDHVALAKAIAGLGDRTSPVAVVGDGKTPFRCVGAVVYTLQVAGLSNIGFVQSAPGTADAGGVIGDKAAEPARP